MALAGIFIFKESFAKAQWLGLVAVCVGLYLFFYDQLAQSKNEEIYNIGVLVVIASALTWAIYAVFQKALLRTMSPLQILVSIYIFSSLMLFRYAAWGPLANLNFREWAALGFVCTSNVLAFVCFSESLKYWDSAKIAAVSCLAPMVTIGFMFLLAGSALHVVRPENLGANAILGAIITIAGSVLVAFFGQSKNQSKGSNKKA